MTASLSLEVVPVTAFGQNCSILWNPDTHHAVVVDPGGDVPRIMAFIERHGLSVDAIWLTHGHLDHVGGADALRRTLSRRQGVPVPVIGPEKGDAPLLASIPEQAALFGLTGLENVQPDRFVKHGEVLDCLGHEFEVRHVPGHTPGHVIFYDPASRFALVGDTLFSGSVGRTDLPYGDHDQLIASIRRELLPLGDDVTILPGHGPATTIGAERTGNSFLA
ncbi:MBL fold metallo-hydrolase [Komagataeibacter kakiaceti JCM 25156]|uniref:MBL fold metallo-hydrolase n=1 Tax=Komagataeibacter kakiaceti TaxID=943261 RepID=UPI00046EFE93|nr:MBL fold metallo-hydrolase [Komagataeibacter kakiaceti]